MKVVLCSGISEFVNGGPFYEAVVSIAENCVEVALLMIPLLLIIQVGISIIQGLFSGDSGMPKFENIFVVILIWVLVASYVPLIQTFYSAIDLVVVSTEFDGKDGSKMNVFAELVRVRTIGDNKLAGEALEKGEYFEALKLALDISTDAVFSIKDLILSYIMDGILTLVRGIVEVLMAIVLNILFIVGPLAFAFSCMPILGEGILKNWLLAVISIKCWGITMNVIDSLLYYYNLHYMSAQMNNTDSWDSMPMKEIVNVGFLVLYVMIPTITNYFIKGSGGAMFSKAIGAATTLVSSAMAVKTMGASKAAGAASKSTADMINKIYDKVNAKGD